MTDAPRPPAGWYPDENLADSLRYWDGNSWTEHRAPASGRMSEPRVQRTQAQTGQVEPRRRRKVGGWLLGGGLAVLLLGLVLALKNGMDANIARGRQLADAMTLSACETRNIERWNLGLSALPCESADLPSPLLATALLVLGGGATVAGIIVIVRARLTR